MSSKILWGKYFPLLIAMLFRVGVRITSLREPHTALRATMLLWSKPYLLLS